jgi:hypothetical protein
MVKLIFVIIGIIPVIIALLIAIPLMTRSDIPFSAAHPNDAIEIEYTKYQLKKISYGVTERTGSQKTEILNIKNNGEAKYSVIENEKPKPDIKIQLTDEELRKLRSIIKETGFITIPSESFPLRENLTDYQKSNIKIILNGHTNQIHWPEQNATDKFIPPIISEVESQLDRIIERFSK